MESEMTAGAIDGSQRKAARVAGFMYLLLMATGILGFSLRSSLIVPGNAAKTIGNIVASERLFRASTAIDLLTCAGEAVIAVALYTLLKRVNRSLALLATLWKVTDGAILGVSAMITLVLLLFLSGAPYLQAFSAQQLHALASLTLRAYATGYTVGFVFLAFGGTLFSYLLFKSRYIPRALAAWGIFAYSVMLIGVFSAVVLPHAPAALELATEAPAGVFEIVAGLWLLLKGVNGSNWGWFSTGSLGSARP